MSDPTLALRSTELNHCGSQVYTYSYALNLDTSALDVLNLR